MAVRVAGTVLLKFPAATSRSAPGGKPPVRCDDHPKKQIQNCRAGPLYSSLAIGGICRSLPGRTEVRFGPVRRVVSERENRAIVVSDRRTPPVSAAPAP